MVLDNSVLDLIRKKIASSKSDDDSADQTSIVKDVTQNIKLLLKVTPLLSPREIIQYCSLYTSLVCENYLYTAIEEIPSLLLHNSVQISLQKTAAEYCQKRISELKAVLL